MEVEDKWIGGEGEGGTCFCCAFFSTEVTSTYLSIAVNEEKKLNAILKYFWLYIKHD